MENAFSWEERQIVGASKVKNHTATLVGRRLYIHGGFCHSEGHSQSSTWILDCSSDVQNLRQVNVSGSFVPLQRNGHSANLIEDKLYVLGGWGGFSTLSDVVYLDLVLCQWFAPQLHGKDHPLMNMHVSAYMEHLGQIICFGGGNGMTFISQTTALDVRSMRWTELKPKGAIPEGRANSSSCKQGFTMYVFGGWNSRANLSDIHLLHLPQMGARSWWSSPQISESPSLVRVGAGLALFRNKIFVFGGYNRRALGDVQIYDPAKETWLRHRTWRRNGSSTKSDSALFSVFGMRPVPRSGHSFTAIGDRYILAFGGMGDAAISRIVNKVALLCPA